MFNNLNKPTSPKWGRIAAACAAASGFIAAYGLVKDMHGFIIAGGILGILGTIIPILMPPSTPSK